MIVQAMPYPAGPAYAPPTDIQFVGQMGRKCGGGGAGTGAVTFALADGLASTPEEGDLVVIAQMASRYPTHTAAFEPSIGGYDKIYDSVVLQGGLADISQVAWYKFMGETPDTTWEASSVSATSNRAAFQVMVFRGVDLSNPFMAAAQIASGIGSGNFDPPDINVGGATIDPGTIGATTTGSNLHVFASFGLRSATGQRGMPVVTGGECNPASGDNSPGNLHDNFYFESDGGSGYRQVSAIGVYGEP